LAGVKRCRGSRRAANARSKCKQRAERNQQTDAAGEGGKVNATNKQKFFRRGTAEKARTAPESGAQPKATTRRRSNIPVGMVEGSKNARHRRKRTVCAGSAERAGRNNSQSAGMQGRKNMWRAGIRKKECRKASMCATEVERRIGRCCTGREDMRTVRGQKNQVQETSVRQTSIQRPSNHNVNGAVYGSVIASSTEGRNHEVVCALSCVIAAVEC
jgi:hypothetical protein